MATISVGDGMSAKLAQAYSGLSIGDAYMEWVADNGPEWGDIVDFIESETSLPFADGWSAYWTATTTTAFAPSLDGQVLGQNALYSVARETATSVSASGSTVVCGQQFNGSTHSVYQTALRFDTSSIPDDAIITEATLSLAITTAYGVVAWTAEVYAAPIGATLDIADFVNASEIAGVTQVAILASSAMTNGARNSFTSLAALLTNISKTGFTELMILSSRQRTNNAASGNLNEVATFHASEASGTTDDPKLTVTYV